MFLAWRANLSTHTSGNMLFCCCQRSRFLLMCHCVHYRLQMQMTASSSLRINLQHLWRDCDTHPSDKHLRQESRKENGSSNSQSHAPPVSVNHNLCLSSAQAHSLYYWWPVGLETRRAVGPARHSVSLSVQHTHKHTYLRHTHPWLQHQILLTLGSVYDCVCNAKCCYNSEGKLAVWKLALSLVYILSPCVFFAHFWISLTVIRGLFLSVHCVIFQVFPPFNFTFSNVLPSN